MKNLTNPIVLWAFLMHSTQAEMMSTAHAVKIATPNEKFEE